MGTALFALAAAGLLVTATLLVASLRLHSAVAFAVGLFTVAWTAAVVETMLLSLARSWTRGWTLAAIAAGLGVSIGVWRRAGRPRPPSPAPVLRRGRDALGDPVLALLVVANVLAGAYLMVVALALPPFDVDVAVYHLPRIVMWIQQQAVAAIPNAPGSNLDANPPGAEIAQGLTMLLAQSDRYTALFQVACIPVGALAVGGTARRIGLDVRAALFGAMLYAAFPLVALQASTAYNDLAVVTALVTACYFALGESRAELGLCALAVALALTTKFSGLLGLPSVALFALVALPAGRRLRVIVAGLAGCAVGSWWYAYNLARTGTWDGHLATDYGQTPSRAPDEVFLRLERYVLQTLDLAGVVGRDRWLFPMVAFLVAGAALVAWRSSARRAAGLAAAAALVALAPWLIMGAHQVGARAVARSWTELGRPGVTGDFPVHAAARPFPAETWFGPTLAIALPAAVVVAWRTTSGHRRLVLLTALIASPMLLYLVNASAFVYDPYRGRFFAIAGALAATGLGILLRVRPLAWATATIATLTLSLSLVHSRPMGIRLLEPLGHKALWEMPRWEAQQVLVHDDPASLRTARTLAQRLPRSSTVGIVAGIFSPLYPLMGAGPWRTIRFIPARAEIPADVEYVAVAPGIDKQLPRSTWKRVPDTPAWPLYRRETG